jgi:putative addiction module killer protein
MIHWKFQEEGINLRQFYDSLHVTSSRSFLKECMGAGIDIKSPICDNKTVNKIRYTAVFRIWFNNLKDLRARVRIDLRLNAVKKGDFGVQRSIGNGVFELKIDYGPGYRVYYKKAGNEIVVLLCGGEKSTQDADIAKAKELVEELENGTV